MGCGQKFAYVDVLSNPEIRANLPAFGNWPPSRSFGLTESLSVVATLFAIWMTLANYANSLLVRVTPSPELGARSTLSKDWLLNWL